MVPGFFKMISALWKQIPKSVEVLKSGNLNRTIDLFLHSSQLQVTRRERSTERGFNGKPNLRSMLRSDNKNSPYAQLIFGCRFSLYYLKLMIVINDPNCSANERLSGRWGVIMARCLSAKLTFITHSNHSVSWKKAVFLFTIQNNGKEDWMMLLLVIDSNISGNQVHIPVPRYRTVSIPGNSIQIEEFSNGIPNAIHNPPGDSRSDSYNSGTFLKIMDKNDLRRKFHFTKFRCDINKQFLKSIAHASKSGLWSCNASKIVISNISMPTWPDITKKEFDNIISIIHSIPIER